MKESPRQKHVLKVLSPIDIHSTFYFYIDYEKPRKLSSDEQVKKGTCGELLRRLAAGLASSPPAVHTPPCWNWKSVFAIIVGGDATGVWGDMIPLEKGEVGE